MYIHIYMCVCIYIILIYRIYIYRHTHARLCVHVRIDMSSRKSSSTNLKALVLTGPPWSSLSGLLCLLQTE